MNFQPDQNLNMNDFFQQGQNAIKAKNLNTAIEMFKKALQQSPKNPNVLASLGQALCWDDHYLEGIEFLRAAGRQLSKKAKINGDTRQLILLAEQLQFWNDYPGSLDLLRQAVRIDSSNLRGFQLLAHTLSRLNKHQPAYLAGKQAISKAPDSPVLNLLMASLEIKTGRTDNAYKRLTGILNSASKPEEKFHAHKEIANLLDKQGKYSEAFRHLQFADSLSSELPAIKKLDKSFIGNMLTQNTHFYSEKLLNQYSEISRDTAKSPVFIVGFFRSGSTLTQEVLNTHPDTFVSDEVDFIFPLRKALQELCPGQTTIYEQLQHLSEDDIKKLRELYWTKVRLRYGDKVKHKLFIDKTTMHTFELGFIHIIFPDSRIIFVKRDPRDVCISCFMQIMQPNLATMHLFQWQDIATLYQQTMNWWLGFKQICNLQYIEISYEDAVTQFETTYQKLFEFLNLSWTDQATNFHKHNQNKFISSPSYDQVSKPLYASSKTRWLNYKDHFTAVKDKLSPIIESLGYPPF